MRVALLPMPYALARGLPNDVAVLAGTVARIASLDNGADGVQFLQGTATGRIIREEALYAGIRVTMDTRLATAEIRFRIDVNFGDPVTPGLQRVTLPSLRASLSAVQILGYSIESLLAEKIATAINLGPVNTRVRDYADIYTLTRQHDLGYLSVREALLRTAAFRGTPVRPLSAVINNLAEIRRPTYAAYRRSRGIDGSHLPEDFTDLVGVVCTFADELAKVSSQATRWDAPRQVWLTGSG